MMAMGQYPILRDGIDPWEIFGVFLLQNTGFFSCIKRDGHHKSENWTFPQTERSSDLGKSPSPLLADWAAHRASSQQPGSLQEAWLWLQRLECVIPWAFLEMKRGVDISHSQNSQTDELYRIQETQSWVHMWNHKKWRGTVQQLEQSAGVRGS